MCHSENRYGDKQNKNRWNLQTVNTTWKIDSAINLIKTVGTCKLCCHSENKCYDKPNKNSWGLQTVLSLGNINKVLF